MIKKVLINKKDLLKEEAINISIKNNGKVELTFDVNGLKKTKYIKFNDLFGILNASFEDSMNDETKQDSRILINETDLLPCSNNVYTIKVNTYADNRITIFLLKKTSLMDFLYTSDQASKKEEDGMYFDVRIPTLIFKISFVGLAISNADVFAVKNKDANNITKDTELFRYPFSNVFAGGNICFGSIERPSYKTLSAAKSFPDYFLNTKMNLHNYTGSNSSELTLPSLLRVLKNKEEFPEIFLKQFYYSSQTFLGDIL